MKVELRVGDLTLERATTFVNGVIKDAENQWVICHSTVEQNTKEKSVYVVAFICKGNEGCDMRTVGDRPWRMENATTKEFMAFAKFAMKLIEEFVV